ncbi:hypothetical protein NHX12_019676 [Muraenolepis orangiensis]|uniref:Uncharacterized protein n=1 Tax=Muraenolepis orangiensis TaxID=630683 RepID=A0A9Q0EYZ1_9TELE|nr:hypothetical protein NHX12_019676 [Muraenolepis orangiensis]
MLKWVLESKDAIISTLALINAHIDALDQEEWEALQETCTVLEPFEQNSFEFKGISLKMTMNSSKEAKEEAASASPTAEDKPDTGHAAKETKNGGRGQGGRGCFTQGRGAAVLLAPAALGAAGFTAAGITVGSYAAGMMSAAAVANGGAVAAGTTVAVLQSVGAVGLGTAATAATACTGGVVTAALAALT